MSTLQDKHAMLPELEEEEQTLGTPSFEVLVRDGRALATGTYFMVPPLYMRQARWSDDVPDRLIITASDGSTWYADKVPRNGKANVVLHPLAT